MEPVYNTFPSLINLAFRLFTISPSITFDPATLPIFETLKILLTSADPTILLLYLVLINLIMNHLQNLKLHKLY